MALVEDAAAGLAAVARGATILQLRAPGRPARSLEREALELVAASRLPVLVSARSDVAAAAGAAGVNLPEGDLPVAAARRLLGEASLIGRSVHSLDAARQAQAEGADYALLGPIFETPTHQGRPGLGLEVLAQAAARLTIPVLAIGGVSADLTATVLATGAAGFAAIGHFRP